MLKHTMLVGLIVMAASGVASAGGQAGTIGVGAEFQLNTEIGGASVNYDAGAFHVGGVFNFTDPPGGDNTVVGFGARFYYHVHSTAMSDFGLGGTFGFLSIPRQVMGNVERQTDVFLEPGVQVRVFLASNVAISATTGIVIGLGDADGVAITGQTITGGIHYYFF